MRVIQKSEALRLYSLGDISMHVLGRIFEVLSTILLCWNGPPGLEPRYTSRVKSRSACLGRAAQQEWGGRDGRGGTHHRYAIFVRVYSRSNGARDQPADATRQDVIVPTTTEGLLDKAGLTKCAILLDPSVPSPSSPEGISTVGLHTSPIAVLDFRSLYPSIMVQHN